MYVCPVLGSPDMDPALQMCLSKAEQRWMITSHDLVETLFLPQPRKLCSFLLQRHVAGYEPISSPQGLSSPSELPLEWVGPQCVMVHCIIPPNRGRDWLFPLLNHVKSLSISPACESPPEWQHNQLVHRPHCFVSSANCPIVQVTVEDTRQCLIQYHPLDYFTNGWPPSWPVCLSTSEQLSFKSTLLLIYLAHISSDFLWDLLGDSVKRLS